MPAGSSGTALTTRVPPPTPLSRVDQPTRERLVLAAVAVGGLAVIVMWWRDTSPASLVGPGPWLEAAGRVLGLVGTYLVVVEVLLMARIAPLDRLIGMDRLAVWHRRNGEYSISLLVGHAVTIIWGYALVAHEGLTAETTSVVLTYPDMLAATIGLGLLVVIGIMSARAVRHRVKYQTWYFIHLYTYLALALSFAHQFSTGADFATHPVNRAIWIAMYAVVGALLVAYRIVKPLRDAARHRMVVAQVVPEGAGLTSVYVVGQRLDKLRAESGQFFLWRFLTRAGWWQAHPYSLSAAPNGNWLRLTIKNLGDHSSQLSALHAGTRVMAEGPYGAFTVNRRRQRQVLLIGAGIGIAPLRALLESLPAGPGDLTLVYRAGGENEIAFGPELSALASLRQATVHYLVGSRHEHPEYLTAAHLESLVPNIRDHDVYVCGPPSMTMTVTDALEEIEVPRRNIHREDFEL
jgi:predicted ferric reductase